MEVVRGKREEVLREAAQVFGERVREVLKAKKEVIIGLSGGSSIIPFFEAAKKRRLPWKKIQFFVIDERLVPISDPDSNARTLFEHLWNDLLNEKKISDSQIHVYEFDQLKKRAGLAHYEQEFLKHGDEFDIVIAGVGSDGHVASLFPLHESINASSRLYTLVSSAPKPPAQRMSASLTLLMKSKHVLLFFFGASKKRALDAFLAESGDIEETPCRLFKQIPGAYAFTDHL